MSDEVRHKITAKILGDLRTVQGDTYEEYQAEQDKAIAGLDKDLAFVQAAHAVTNAAPLTQAQPAVAPEPQAAPAQPAPEPQGGLEEMTDKYGAKFTYGIADAPALPDGRGYYVFKEWTDRNGKARKAYVDPVKGPKPAKPGASEAPIIWK